MTSDGGSDTLDPVDGVDDDVLVLPWWQHPVNILTGLVATALIAGMIGWLVHDTVSEPGAGDVEVGFLQDMRVHDVQAFADSMAEGQRDDIVEMEVVLGP